MVLIVSNTIDVQSEDKSLDLEMWRTLIIRRFAVLDVRWVRISNWSRFKYENLEKKE